MEWFAAEQYWLARWLLTRGVALVFAIAFLNILLQWRPLLGTGGLTPAPEAIARTRWRAQPSLFHWRYSDEMATWLAGLGLAVSGLLLIGLPQRGPSWLPMLAFLGLWALYLSYVHVGQIWYGFGWETILCEAGFFAAFLGGEHIAPPWLALLAIRWLVFRIEFGAGLIKLRGDPCWRDLTCLEYHHETQPIPTWSSWFFHRLPRPLHRIEVGANHVAQLVAPVGLFLPQPIAGIAGMFIVVSQAYLMLSGNFAWLNLITIVLAFSAFSDAWLDWLPVQPPGELTAAAPWFVAVVALMAVATVVLSWWPVRNMASRHQRMNVSFNPWKLVGSYGAFGSITRQRDELVIEATTDDPASPDAHWVAYGFKGKPTDPQRRPRQIAPYHLRLDWLLWFAALTPRPTSYAWFVALLRALLDADPEVLRLLRHDPLHGARPRAIRVRRERYRFTTWAQRRASGAWWVHEPRGVDVGPLTRADLGGPGPRRGVWHL